MTLNKSVIITCTAILTSSAYATNGWPQNFKLCNLLGERVNVRIEHPLNLKVSIPGSFGDNSKWDFDLAPRECGDIEAKTDYDKNGISKFRLAIFSYQTGKTPFSVDIRNYTSREDERRKGNFSNVWNISYPGDEGMGWNIYAPISKSTFYEYHVWNSCVQGDCWENVIDDVHQTAGNEIIDLKRGDAGTRLSLISAPNSTQELYIVGEKTSSDSQVDNMLALNVYRNFAKINGNAKQAALKNFNGTPLIADINQYPNLRVCSVSIPTYNVIDGKIKPKNITFTNAEPLLTTIDTTNNNSRTNMTFNTPIYKLTNKTVATTWTTTAWKIGAGVKATGTFVAKGLFADVTKSIEVSMSYEYSASEQKVNTKEFTEELTLPSQQVTLAPGESISYRARLDRVLAKGQFNFEYLIDNISMIGKVALNGDCGSTTNATIDPLIVYNQTEVTLDKGLSLDVANQKVVITGEGNFEGQTGYKTSLFFEQPTTLAPGLNPQNMNNPYLSSSIQQKVANYFKSVTNLLR